MKLVTFLLPEAYLEGLDRLVKKDLYSSRSAAIRFAVQDLLKKEFWDEKGRLPKRSLLQQGRVERAHDK